MRARVNFAIDAFAIVAYVIATNPANTGTPLHEWVGVAVAVAAFVHLVLHWDWAVRVVGRFFRKLGHSSRLNLVVDLLTLVVSVAVVLSGLFVSRSVLRPLGLVVADNSVWHSVHSQSATLLLALVGVHLGLHWGWITSALRHRIFRPILDPIGTFVHLRRRMTASPRLPQNQLQPVLRRGALRTLASLALVLVTASCVYGAVLELNGRLLAPWLTMPGGSGVGLSAKAQVADGVLMPAGQTDAVQSPSASFATTAAVRAAIRSAHAFLVLGLAMAIAIALGGLLSPVGRGRDSG